MKKALKWVGIVLHFCRWPDWRAAVLAALEQGGYLNSTLLIISADHGGHGFRHGDDSPEDRTIPWLAVGPVFCPA